MISSPSPNTPVFTNPFSEAKLYILERILIGMIFLAVVRLAGAAASLFIEFQITGVATVIITTLLLGGVVIAKFNQAAAYEIRVSLLLISIFIFGLQDAVADRLVVGSGQLILIAFVIFTFILFDNRMGFAAAVLSGLTIFLINYASRAVNHQVIVEFYLGAPGFIIPIASFVVVAAALILSIGRLLLGIEEAIEQEKELAQELEDEEQMLQARIVNRQQTLLTSTQINQELSQLLDEERIIEAAVTQIWQIFKVSNVQLYKLDQQEGDLKLQKVVGDQSEALSGQPITLTIGFGSIGKAAVSQEVVTIVKPDHSQPHILPTTESMLAIPISYEQSLYGILLIQHHERTALNEDISYALKLVAEQIAIAIRNAQQYSRAQKLLVYEELVNDMRLKIQNATTIEDVLQTAATELGTALNTPQIYVKIGRERRGI